MKSSVHAIMTALAEFDKTSASVGLELQLSLAEMILRELRRKGWTQRDLAAAAAMKEPFVSRVLHGDQNCTLQTAGRLLFALGVRARFQQARGSAASEDTGCGPLQLRQDETYGEPIQNIEADTGGIIRGCFPTSATG